MSETGKWVRFERLPKGKRKTDVFDVMHKDDPDLWLGTIKWYSPWRQYCFYPSTDKLFARSCLDDISLFIDGLMKKRKS